MAASMSFHTPAQASSSTITRIWIYSLFKLCNCCGLYSLRDRDTNIVWWKERKLRILQWGDSRQFLSVSVLLAQYMIIQIYETSHLCMYWQIRFEVMDMINYSCMVNVARKKCYTPSLMWRRKYLHFFRRKTQGLFLHY